jgi:DNA polymerase-1
MIELPCTNPTYLVNDVAELPALEGASVVYLDFETTSGNPKLDSLNPWHNCKVALIAITVDDNPTAYAIPYMHFSEGDKDTIQQWLGGILYSCEIWENQNVKYDAHVAANDLALEPQCVLSCTLTKAKIIDSDRITRGGYGLDALARDWIGEDLSSYYQSLTPYVGEVAKNKDYGKVPADILGAYACAQVHANRRLKKYIDWKFETTHQQCCDVRDTEIELTRNLWKMERNGLPIDKAELQINEYKLLKRMVDIDDELHKIVGEAFNPNSSKDLYNVLCIKYGLPILAFTKDDKTGEDTNNPSFDKHAMLMYEAHPSAPKDVITLIKEYKTDSQTLSLFIQPWQGYAIFRPEFAVWVLNSTYNQCVRTGRMSCGEPNAQQLSKRVKKLIHPKKGFAFISLDYSQIEFRFIVHYIADSAAIKAFRDDPDTDFHLLVASWCEIPRKPAKNVNFAVAFGEGKKKLIKQLASNKELVDSIVKQIKQMIADGELQPELETKVFNQLAIARGEEVYNRYHRTFPSLKRTMKQAETACKMRGYVFNIRGRHRHLPARYAYRAFNTVNQSSAADLQKERLNALCRMIEGTSIELSACVHDETLLQAPIEIAYDPRTIRDLVLLLENPPYADKISVPIRCSVGVSKDNWCEASESEMQQPFEEHKILLRERDYSQFRNLEHLREYSGTTTSHSGAVYPEDIPIEQGGIKGEAPQTMSTL